MFEKLRTLYFYLSLSNGSGRREDPLKPYDPESIKQAIITYKKDVKNKVRNKQQRNFT